MAGPNVSRGDFNMKTLLHRNMTLCSARVAPHSAGCGESVVAGPLLYTRPGAERVNAATSKGDSRGGGAAYEATVHRQAMSQCIARRTLGNLPPAKAPFTRNWESRLDALARLMRGLDPRTVHLRAGLADHSAECFNGTIGALSSLAMPSLAMPMAAPV